MDNFREKNQVDGKIEVNSGDSVNESGVEQVDASSHFVAVSSRTQTLWQMFVIMMGFTFFSPSMIAGGQLGLGLNMRDFIIAVVLGNLFLCIYTGLLGYVGQQTGFSLDALAMKSFGVKGSFVPSLLIGITQMGWTGVGLAMFALPVANYFNMNPYLLVGIFGILVLWTTLHGVKGIAALGTIAVLAILILGLYSTYVSVDAVDGVAHLFSDNPAKPLTMSTALSIVIGNFISGGTATPNFTRYGKNAVPTIIATGIAFFIGNILMFVFGASGAGAFGKADIFDVLIMQGLAIPGVLSLGFNIWTTNNNSLYTAGLSFSSVSKMSFKKSTVLMGVLATLLSVFLYNNFTAYLSFLGAMIPPIGGIIIVHYFMHRKDYQDQSFSDTIDYKAIIALVIGILFGTFYQHGIASVNSLVMTVVVYLFASLIQKAK